jgi:peptidoglycan/LPS O-acetylase OafA/YrhL
MSINKAKNGEGVAPQNQAVVGLRGIAVILVILTHLNVPTFNNGFIGVDIFFTISGFLITNRLVLEYLDNRRASKRQGWISLVGFYSRRARKIIPASLATLIATCLLWKFFGSVPPFTSVFDDSIWSVLFLANVHFVDQATNYFAAHQGQSPVLHFWSLAVEEQFYLIWPLLFLTAISTPGFKIFGLIFNWRKRVLFTITTVSFASFIYFAMAQASNPVGSYFSTTARIWEFGIGAIAALWSAENRTSVKNIFFIALMIFLAVIFFGTSKETFRLLLVFPLALLAYLLNIIVTKGESNILSNWLETRILIFFGKISFSLYLVHWPLIVFLEDHKIHIFGYNLFWIIPTLLLSATFLYHEVESRFMKVIVPTASKRSSARRTRYFPLKTKIIRYSCALAVIFVVTINLQTDSQQSFLSSKFQPKVADPWSPPNVTQSIEPVPDETRMDSTETKLANPSKSLDWNKKIESGILLTSVPLGIQPNVSQLDSERLSIWDKCLMTTKDRPSCNFGSVNSTRKVYVIGDSYALSMLPMISKAFDGSDFYGILRTRANCMIPLVRTVLDGHDDNDCYLHRNEVNSEISEVKPFLVIAMSLNSNTISGNRNTLISGMMKEFEYLKNNAENVIIIGETPFSVDPRVCPGASTQLARCVGLDGNRQEFRKLTKEIAQQTGINYVEATDWMCRKSKCPTIIDGNFVTWDGGHLTKEFSLKLAPLFKSKLHIWGIL